MNVIDFELDQDRDNRLRMDKENDQTIPPETSHKDNRIRRQFLYRTQRRMLCQDGIDRSILQVKPTSF